ncbi:flagellar hook protein FlgE [Limobrevibacterium gyesilva]|uniref:Flagellar hook protein FlgE n=1 Tax=Limobrevibacterium gyesilva TaxID=2991712 RepID=A0AA41YHC0_9PROT|nr:flagellar hook protein FlgE [Limobrevibacterium gyesilva]MCW3473279.1 flagellar hook protein FlgE [Limobrevibacterium gyesilva]
MSLFGAMNTAISGLSAQSSAFGNISDNIANSQTIGYKGVDTAFVDYLTTSTATANNPGAVVARPDYTNTVQGTVAQTNNPLGLAIAGQGFFPVSHPVSTRGSQVAFSPTPYFTRAGDFQMDQNGYLVNSAGEYLNGWSVNAATGVVNRNAVAPIQVSQSVYNPVATTQVDLSANLPATPAAGALVSSQVSIYDSLGTPHVVTLNWSQNAQNDWNVAVNVPDDIVAPAVGSANVKFGAVTSGNPVTDGTVGSVSGGTGTVTTSAFAAGKPATLMFTVDFGNGAQNVVLNLGDYGQTNGVTQYAGSSYALRGISQNGVPPGSFSSVSTTSAGSVVVNYDNGQSRTIAQVPIVTFNNPDALQRQDGQSFTATTTSGVPLTNDAGTNGAGGIVTGSVEQSNVDIATQFTRLIVAQRAYSANAKMITTADELLQQTVDMKR